ncbi:MAG: LPXTG cell wall anchor domain-containing protein, partial [Cyanobacteria bacterium J06554_11]
MFFDQGWTLAGNPWLAAIGVNTLLIAIAFLLPKKLLTPASYAN